MLTKKSIPTLERIIIFWNGEYEKKGEKEREREGEREKERERERKREESDLRKKDDYEKGQVQNIGGGREDER